MNKNVFDEPIRRRGICLLGFVVESVTLDEDSEKKIDQYELSSNQHMQQGALTGAYANAVQEAAKNSSGSMNGYVNVEPKIQESSVAIVEKSTRQIKFVLSAEL